MLFEYRINEDGILRNVAAKYVSIGGRCSVEELSEKHNH